MKNLFIFLGVWLFVQSVNAQTSDISNVSINVVVADDDIPVSAAQNLETKMQRALTINGIGDNGYTERFVLTAKVDIISKDVVPSTPARVSQKMELTFIVGDVVENKVYESVSLSLSGIGTNETKAFIAAFQQFKPQNKDLQDMLSAAKEKIIDYYAGNCDAIVLNAKTLASIQNYDEAIFRLVSVPNVCNECYRRCQNEAANVYQQKVDDESTKLLYEAKTVWATQPNKSGAEKVADIIGNINPKYSHYDDVVRFRNTVTDKLSADEKRAWEFAMKKYEDNQAFKLSIVDACKAIGVAFGNGQPKNITKTIVKGW